MWIPPIEGDPAGMRQAARELQARAAHIGERAAAVRLRIDRMRQAEKFVGPASDRSAERLRSWEFRARRLAEELQALAHLLSREAADVERRQVARRRRLERLKDEARLRR